MPSEEARGKEVLMINNILYIDSCVRQNSRTRRLARHLLSKLEGRITTINLDEKCLSPHTCSSLLERNSLIDVCDFSSEYFNTAKEFANADTIVIAAPYWDMSFPANLKIYIENIMVQGITFGYTEDGQPLGLCKAKELFYVSTAGGPVVPNNEGYEYIKGLANTYWGIEKTHIFQAESLDIVGADVEALLAKTMHEIDGAIGKRKYFI